MRVDVITLRSKNENVRGVAVCLLWKQFKAGCLGAAFEAPNGTFCINLNTCDWCIIIVRETTRAKSGTLDHECLVPANGHFFFHPKN